MAKNERGAARVEAWSEASTLDHPRPADLPLRLHRVALVSCVKSKLGRPAPARDLYVSELFRGSRAYAERHAGAWFILSAKYGLLHPDTVIEPYELTLKTMSTADRRAWARGVHSQMQEAGLLQPGTTFLWLAGADYQRDLRAPLSAYDHEDPLTGLNFRQRIQWLGQQVRGRSR